jgi:hypothetical protein
LKSQGAFGFHKVTALTEAVRFAYTASLHLQPAIP